MDWTLNWRLYAGFWIQIWTDWKVDNTVSVQLCCLMKTKMLDGQKGKSTTLLLTNQLFLLKATHMFSSYFQSHQLDGSELYYNTQCMNWRERQGIEIQLQLIQTWEFQNTNCTSTTEPLDLHQRSRCLQQPRLQASADFSCFPFFVFSGTQCILNGDPKGCWPVMN